jgi:hypothetical protein
MSTTFGYARIGQLESLRFKRVKNKIKHLHGKQNRLHCGFTIPNQRVKPKTRGNFRLGRKQPPVPRGSVGRGCYLWRRYNDP